jgi:hypothetical protein
MSDGLWESYDPEATGPCSLHGRMNCADCENFDLDDAESMFCSCGAGPGEPCECEG